MTESLKIVHNVDPTVKGAGGARGASASRTHRADPLFEVMFLAQVLEPYTPGARLTGAERGKINRAAKEARDAGYTADDVSRAIAGWPRAMGNARITALGLAANLGRCLNAASGRAASRELTDVERALAALSWLTEEGEHEPREETDA